MENIFTYSKEQSYNLSNDNMKYTHNIYMCPDKEKGCSARVLVKVVSCRGEDLLSNDIKYVMIR